MSFVIHSLAHERKVMYSNILQEWHCDQDIDSELGEHQRMEQ